MASCITCRATRQFNVTGGGGQCRGQTLRTGEEDEFPTSMAQGLTPLGILRRPHGELLPGHAAPVLDYGCSEALSADRVLTLCDAARSVEAALAARHASNAAIATCTPSGLADVPDGRFDLIVVNSVLQYLDKAAFAALLAECRRLLAEDGQVLFADIIQPDLNPLGDAALLRLAYLAQPVRAAA